MVLRSFFRKTSTKIYLLIVVLIISTLIVLNNIILKTKEKYNEMFVETNLIYTELKSKNELKIIKNENIKQAKEVLIFTYKYIPEIEEYKIGILDNNKIIVYKDIDFALKLDDTESIIGLNSLEFINIKPYLKNILNKSSIYKYNDKDLNLDIYDVIDFSRTNGIIISETLFNKIQSKNNHSYILTAKNEKSLIEINNYLKENKIKYEILEFNSFNDKYVMEKLKSTVNELLLGNYILIAIFLIVVVVINANIYSDMKYNINLEKVLGYYKGKVIINIFLRFASLYFCSIFFSIILSFILNQIILILI